jgi:hypothetical protein
LEVNKKQNKRFDNYSCSLIFKSEKYEHAKSRMEINDLKDKVETLLNETDFFKNELEKERCAYANV